MSFSNYPPGVTGREWQIAGPDEGKCDQCGGLVLGIDGNGTCRDCGETFSREDAKADEADRQYDLAAEREYDDGF